MRLPNGILEENHIKQYIRERIIIRTRADIKVKQEYRRKKKKCATFKRVFYSQRNTCKMILFQRRYIIRPLRNA